MSRMFVLMAVAVIAIGAAHVVRAADDTALIVKESRGHHITDS